MDSIMCFARQWLRCEPDLLFVDGKTRIFYIGGSNDEIETREFENSLHTDPLWRLGGGSMKVLIRINLIIVVSILMLLGQAPGSALAEERPRPVSVLVLLGEWFGDAYFPLQEEIAGRGWIMKRVGVDPEYRGCYNKKRDVVLRSDILIPDVKDFSGYDCLIIPSGPQFRKFIDDPAVLQFIRDAHSAGLIVASFCVGNYLVKAAGLADLPDGPAAFPQIVTLVAERVLVGPRGGGPPPGDGFESAPIAEICDAIARELARADSIECTDGGNVIPFTVSNNKTILPVHVGNGRPLRIILDSGMGWDGLLVYNPDMRDSLHLVNPQSANLGGAGQGNAQTALVSDSMSFSIGNVEFENQRIVVLQGESFRGFPSDGVVGYSLLGHYAVEVNYDNATLTLHAPGELHIDESWKAVPIFFKDNNIPWMNASVVIENGEPIPISCYIDFASSEAIELLLKPDQKFSVPRETEDVYLGRGLSGDINGKKGRIAKVILGPYELKNVSAAFAPAQIRSKQSGADGVIAGNLLRRFNLIFDYAGKKLYMKPNSRFNEPF
jgi:hypothetical protein